MRTAAAVIVCLLGASAFAQDSAPESRRERWQYRKVGTAPDVSGRSVLARADDQGDTITIFADGFAYYTIEKTYHSDMVGEPDEKHRQHWVTQLPPSVVVRIQGAAATAISRRTPISREELLDLTRFPRDERRKTMPHMTGGHPWSRRHQEDDGSWSPGDFEFHCDEDKAPLCTGRGRERFRVGGTALLALNYVNAGYGPSEGGPYREVVRLALGWVLRRQRPHGGFCDESGTVAALNDAFATILLCRTVVLLRQQHEGSFATEAPASRSWTPEQVSSAAASAVRRIGGSQSSDGAWSDDANVARRLSTTLWSLLALKAGKTAGIETRPETATRALAWIEKQVATIEAAGPPPAADVSAMARARAMRAAARRATGADLASVADDFGKLTEVFEAGGPDARDAETILLGTLVAVDLADSLRDRWNKAVRPLLFDTLVRDGCAEGSYAVPTLWWDEGGRIVSTGLMTWAMEAYYKYPYALLFDERR